MVQFASPEWIAEFDEAVRTIDVDGPDLRVRYLFPGGGVDDARTGDELGYDLVFGRGVRAEPTSAGDDPAVTIVQPLAVARRVAAGEVAAQQALLDGSIRITGAVTELLAWGRAVVAIDAAVVSLRSRTDWPD
jgi:hypothetical protein